MTTLRKYETLYLMRPDLSEDDRSGISEKIQKLITDQNGTVLKVEPWPLRQLAYKVSKHSQGYYVLMEYAAPSSLISELVREFRLDERILKFNTSKLTDSFTPETKIEKEQEPASQGMEEQSEEEEKNE